MGLVEGKEELGLQLWVNLYEVVESGKGGAGDVG